MRARLGVDVGGTGIKGALVDLDKGVLHTKRRRIETPHPATPAAVAATVAIVAQKAGWTEGCFGCALPAVVTGGLVRTAANIDPSWIGADGEHIISEAVGDKAVLLNDADAAGLAEMRFGAGRDAPGVVLLLTFGTGIGSAVFCDGSLLPNSELGHIELDGVEAEAIASAKVQEDEHLTYPEWTRRVNEYLAAVEAMLWPDLVIIGGGISKEFDEYRELLVSRSRIVPALLRNNAGIIGAALAAEEAQ